MEIKIFNVDCGFCALIVADNNHAALIDCGYNQRTGFRPTSYIMNSNLVGLEHLIISHLSDANLADFPYLMGNDIQSQFPTKFLIKNPSLNADNLPELGIRNNAKTGRINLFSLMSDSYRAKIIHHRFSNISFAFFSNNYPDFLDYNNLSVVTFINYFDIDIIFPSNLTQKGWYSLLNNSLFQDYLKRVNFFVASNHGQESGYVPEIFDYCHPDVVIISNKFNLPITSEMKNKYMSHAKGLKILRSNDKLLTTREHGTITISKPPGRKLEISTSKSRLIKDICQNANSLLKEL
ncbi:hypothetical protein [Nodularia sphaerocarpa]|uniref:hypothetical protein n=1 Tax=Nodularia sphaerocarpa TaxID=137816 RepID=UPI001EFA9872|nr:hypothetical protein [Nodularia sphaerocarpa]MDB9373089.1 hypothetical protein [Nodularia sphaerocarpa CS-585]MDB9378304.1 hypothetical protein [Nodularia sphaerocarpa CS-585A2]ULP73219.1 hypothetical protein BDGGKGIB_02872 [Nodularia sphaerocarpa UHCC 0038]